MSIQTLIIVILFYLAGYKLAKWMMKTEQDADSEIMSKGDEAMHVLLSLLSWIWILVIVAMTWELRIRKTGYWQRPLNQTNEPGKDPAK